MPENLAAFHARVDSFTADSLPHDGRLVTRDSLTAKVAPDGGLRPFFGNTIIFELDDTAKIALSQRQVLLHHHCAPCLAQPLSPETFHLTLHDLINSPDQAAIEDAVKQTELHALLALSLLRRKPSPPIRLRSTHVFSMVNTSVVLGFAPATEMDCLQLMSLYETFHTVVPLNYGLTPHVTLGYYKPGEYGWETVSALNHVIREAEKLPPIELTLCLDQLHYRRFSDMNHYF